jgi:hypothetical protein
MPIAAVRYADGFCFLKVSDFFHVHVCREHVYQNIAADQRNEARAQFGAADELELHVVYGEDVTVHARDAVLARGDSSDEMAVRFLVEQTPMHDVDLFADAEDFRFHTPECLAATPVEGKFCERKDFMTKDNLSKPFSV